MPLSNFSVSQKFSAAVQEEEKWFQPRSDRTLRLLSGDGRSTPHDLTGHGGNSC